MVGTCCAYYTHNKHGKLQVVPPTTPARVTTGPGAQARGCTYNAYSHHTTVIGTLKRASTYARRYEVLNTYYYFLLQNVYVQWTFYSRGGRQRTYAHYCTRSYKSLKIGPSITSSYHDWRPPFQRKSINLQTNRHELLLLWSFITESYPNYLFPVDCNSKLLYLVLSCNVCSPGKNAYCFAYYFCYYIYHSCYY
jgi:hypothetical protein